LRPWGAAGRRVIDGGGGPLSGSRCVAAGHRARDSRGTLAARGRGLVGDPLDGGLAAGSASGSLAAADPAAGLRSVHACCRFAAAGTRLSGAFSRPGQSAAAAPGGPAPDGEECAPGGGRGGRRRRRGGRPVGRLAAPSASPSRRKAPAIGGRALCAGSGPGRVGGCPRDVAPRSETGRPVPSAGGLRSACGAGGDAGLDRVPASRAAPAGPGDRRRHHHLSSPSRGPALAAAGDRHGDPDSRRRASREASFGDRQPRSRRRTAASQ